MGTKYKDIKIGDIFGRLTVIEKSKKDGYKQFWVCQCSCENSKTTIVNGSSLTNGHIKSCGCLRKENTTKACLARSIKTFQQWCIEK